MRFAPHPIFLHLELQRTPSFGIPEDYEDTSLNVPAFRCLYLFIFNWNFVVKLELIAKIVILFASIAVFIWKRGQSGHVPSILNNGVLKKAKPFLCWLQPLVGCSEDGSREPTQCVLPPSEPPSISASPCTCLTVTQRSRGSSFRASKKPLSLEGSFTSCPLPWPAPRSSLLGCPLTLWKARVYSRPCLPGPSLTALWNSEAQAGFPHGHKHFLMEGAFIRET